jgi:hypothetical protein
MSRVQRLDRSGSLLKPYRTPEGFLFAEGYATRAGIFEYENADGSIRRELRSEEEVSRADSLGSLGNKPVALLHPMEENASGELEPVDVTPENWDRYAAGTVSPSVTYTADGYVKVAVMVGRQDAIEAIEGGEAQELSCGYSAEVIERAGEHPIWGHYDAVQTDIQYNHCALVPQGRAGANVRLRVDGAIQRPNQPTQGAPMDPKKAKPATPAKRADEMPADEVKTDAEMEIYDAESMMRDMCAKMDQVMENQAAMADVTDKLIEVLEMILPEDADVEIAAEGEEMREDADGEPAGEGAAEMAKRGDAKSGHAYYKERVKLLEIAQHLRVDGADRMLNPALRKAVVKAIAPDAPAKRADNAIYQTAVIDSYSAQINQPRKPGQRPAQPAPKLDDLGAGRGGRADAAQFGDRYTRQRERLAGIKKPTTP